jgi:hypothetical protein
MINFILNSNVSYEFFSSFDMNLNLGDCVVSIVMKKFTIFLEGAKIIKKIC